MIEKIFVFVCSALLSACNQSCELQGGKIVQDGWFYVQQTVGGISYMQQHPNYVCKKEKDK